MEFQKGYNDQICANEIKQQNGVYWLEFSFHRAWKEESLKITHSSIDINEIWDGIRLVTAKNTHVFRFWNLWTTYSSINRNRIVCNSWWDISSNSFQIISVPSSNNCPIYFPCLLVDWVEYATQKNQTILPYNCTYYTRDTLGRTWISLHQQVYVCILNAVGIYESRSNQQSIQNYECLLHHTSACSFCYWLCFGWCTSNFTNVSYSSF